MVKEISVFIYMALMLLASCSTQNGFMIKKDKDGSKMLLGIGNKASLMNDKAFKWFKEGYDSYQPDTNAVKTIRKIAPSLHFEVFAGTWCSDTHELLPRFYKVMDAAGIPESQLRLHLLGRSKKNRDGSSDQYHITNLPTFVFLTGDTETGRVIENVKVSIEADIAAILAGKK